jgi:hypothetical protein
VKRTLVTFCLVFVAWSAAGAQSSDNLQETLAAVRSFFAELGYLPIIVPADEKVGDTYRFDGWRLVDRAENCFPGLADVASVETSVPLFVKTGKAQASILARISSLFSFGASAEMTDEITIHYRDVRKAQVTDNELRSAISTECPHIRNILECRFDACTDWRQEPLVLGTVLYARQSVFVGTNESAEAHIDIDLENLQSGLPSGTRTRTLDATAAATAGFGTTSGVLLQNDELVPVAFQPAFLPLAVFQDHRGPGGSTEKVLIGVERWVTYDADNPVHRDIMQKLLEME